MQVSFTGIKNTGYLKSAFDHEKFALLNPNNKHIEAVELMDGPICDYEGSHVLNIHLVDDFKGKHLSKFKEALHKSGLSFHQYKNPVNRDFLNILMTDEIYRENGKKIRENEFYINDVILDLNDEHLPLFSYLGKLIREVAQKPTNKFELNRDYLDSPDLDNGLSIGMSLKDLWKEDFAEEMEKAHDFETVKEGASEMDNLLHDIMMRYFKK